MTKPMQGMAFKRMQAELMNCSVNYEEDEERETTLTVRSLSERGKIPSQTLQECVEDSMKSPRVDAPRVDVTSRCNLEGQTAKWTTGRRVGVPRVAKHSRPPVRKRGRE